jgi:hypothetical protein
MQRLQSDTVRHRQFEKELRGVQSKLLELSFRLARTLDDLPNDDGDDDNPDRPLRHTGRTPIRGRSDRGQNHDSKKFRDQDGPILLGLLPESLRKSYNLLAHIYHSCNIPLLPLDAIVATTIDLCSPNVPGSERQQHSMDLYFKLASHGILPKSKHTATWLTMF